MTLQIFISYSRKDQTFAERLCDQLHKWGCRTWIDLHNIPSGAYWPDEIDKGLTSADVVVGLMSAKTFDSRNVKNEWDWALENGKPLIPLRLQPPESIPHRYISINYIDLSDEVNGFTQLKDALIRPETRYRDDILIPPETNPPSPTKTEVTNRAAMLQNVHDFWVSGVLQKALEAGQFEFGLEHAQPEVVLKHTYFGDYALPSSAKILDVFKDMDHELLILGTAGAGKTILLLQLAQSLIEQARLDEKQRIPVVFNLSSWAAKRKPLADWLIEELRLKYQVPKKVAKEWVDDERLLLLLDGLDEVAEDYRNNCVDAINMFRQKYKSVDLAVCSRIADYEALTSKLNLHGALTLQPLSQEQINHYIDRPELSALRELLPTDATLQNMAPTPFLLNTMAYAYRDASPASLLIPASDDPARTRRTHLFDAYVEKRLDSKSSTKYTHAQTRYYLAWLASIMVKTEETSGFYVDGLQPQSTLSLGIQYTLYVFVSGFLIALLSSVPGAIATGFIAKITLGTSITPFAILMGALGGGIAGGLGIGIYIGLIGMLSSLLGSALFLNTPVNAVAFGALASGAVMGFSIGLGIAIAQRFAMVKSEEIYIKIISGLLGSLVAVVPILFFTDSMSVLNIEIVGGLLVGVGGTLILMANEKINRHFGFLGMIERQFRKRTNVDEFRLSLSGAVIDPVDSIAWSWTKAVVGILFGVPVGLVIALSSGIGVALSITGVIIFITAMRGKQATIETRNVPNQNIRKSIRNSLIMGVIGGMLGGLVAAVLMDATWGVLVGLAVGLTGAVTYGGSPVIRHFVLRCILTWNSAIPWNFSRFLDRAAEQVLLRKVGGGYIFVHRSLMEYFAAGADTETS
jgi:TIR domain-containing protein/NACHT domain-containing protein